jgi:hypothetical protein
MYILKKSDDIPDERRLRESEGRKERRKEGRSAREEGTAAGKNEGLNTKAEALRDFRV